MQMTDCSFSIPAHNKLPALLAIKDVVSGNQKWWNYANLLQAKTLEEIMRLWYYAVESDPNGDIYSIDFHGDKISNETLMFEAIAPYVTSGSYIQMQGEDGLIWRWVFEDGDFREASAIITFE